MRVYMIRHGMTKGNLERRYVGTTDEPLLPEGREELRERKEARAVNIVYVSPMRRCRETATILFPHAEQICVEEFRECDFGAFEYKNYQELSKTKEYQHFIDTEGAYGFPAGETREMFIARCAEGFRRVCKEHDESEDIVMVVHGGTIMALLDRYSEPHQNYYTWQVKNGGGFSMELVRDGNGGISMCDIKMN